MASPLILAGQALTAGQGQGQLSQYYGYADANQTTVTATGPANLSTLYTIPAGEAYAGAAYELSCGGYGTWGSTQQLLLFTALVGATTLTTSNATAAAASLSVSAAFRWQATVRIVCADGVSAWWGSVTAILQQSANPVLPGTAADNSIPLAGSNTSAHTASVSSAVPFSVQCGWGSTTGAPTITNAWTTFRKVA
jgi:hypothetical protein